MFEIFFKRRKIKKYARNLPLELKKRYGKKKFYSKLQIDAAIKGQGLDANNELRMVEYCYAYAMFCSSNVFNHIHQHSDENCDYTIMRHEISKTLFNEETSFSFSTLLSDSSPTLTDFGINNENFESDFSGWDDSDSSD